MNPTSEELIGQAIATLKQRGPTKIQALAKALGQNNPRSLSMVLQYSRGRVICHGGRWQVPSKRS